MTTATTKDMSSSKARSSQLYLGKVLEAYNKPATQNLTEYILRPSFSLGALEVDQENGRFVYRAKGAKKACDSLGPLELLATPGSRPTFQLYDALTAYVNNDRGGDYTVDLELRGRLGRQGSSNGSVVGFCALADPGDIW